VKIALLKYVVNSVVLVFKVIALTDLDLREASEFHNTV
jgi:hypothetical protein